MTTTVRRVHTEQGSHIEPPLDNVWSPLEKLHWVAAVVNHDHGFALSVSLQGDSDHDVYQITGPRAAYGGGDFDWAWDTLSGISIGVRLAEQRGA
jgi:hypothetical protein